MSLVLVGKSEVDVENSLLSVGALVPDARTILLFVVFLFLLVGSGFLPLRINRRSLASLPQVKLGSLLLGLLCLILLQGHSLGLLRRLVHFLLLLAIFGLFGSFLCGTFYGSLLNAGVGVLVLATRDIIFKCPPVSLSGSSSLLFGLNPGFIVARFPFKFPSSSS